MPAVPLPLAAPRCTSLGDADGHDLPGQHARLERGFAAAVRADGEGVLLLSRDVGGLGRVLRTVSL